ncbi:MAG: GAF domain-containing protein [Pseudomonadota bacterium]
MEQAKSKPSSKTRDFIRIRLRLFEFAISHSLEELIQKTMDEVGKLTESPIGFFHFVESDQKTLSLQAWSTRTVNEFCKAEGKGTHYEIDRAGVWVDCVHQRRPVIHNDYASLPHRKGLPPGHAAIIRELVVPVMRDDRIMAILGVGNKPADYTEDDVEKVSFLADVGWEIVEHKRADEALYKEHEFSKNILNTAQTIIVVLDLGGYIISINTFMEELSGYRLDEIKGKEWFSTFIPARERDNIRVLFKKAVGDIRTKGIVSSILLKDGSERDIEWYDRTLKDKNGKIIGLLVTGQDVTERKRAEKEKEKLITDLKDNLQKVKLLSGMLPICSHCKKIRDDKGYWNQIEAYIRDHSGAEFTHGICPECERKYYQDIDIYNGK